jgi:branched-chain amino acid transport system permease protein
VETPEQRARALCPPWWAACGQSLWPLAASVAVAALLHWVLAPLAGPFYATMLVSIGINIILAVSLTMVNGFTGQFSLGHAGFMAVGGYVAAALVYYGSFRLWDSAAEHGGFLGGGQLLFLGACCVGGLAAAATGYVVGLPSLRLRGDYLAIVTLGFGEIVRVMLQRSGDVLFDPLEIRATSLPELGTHLGGALGFTGLPFYTNPLWVYLFVALTLLTAYRIKSSSQGRAFLAIRDNEIAAEAVGIPVTRYKVRAFVVAAFFAGIAGGLAAHQVGTIKSGELAFQRSIEIVIMVVLGGMGSISGAVIAAAVLTILPEALRSFQDYRMIVYALSLIVMMILRPRGLLGLQELWELAPVRAALARMWPARFAQAPTPPSL